MEMGKVSAKNFFYYESSDSLDTEIQKFILHTEVALDVGCGIVPMNYFRPKIHFLIEPWKEYADILNFRHRSDSSVVVINSDAESILASMMEKSVDSIFLLDVIEHIEKEAGRRIVNLLEKVARQQIILFTPFGFMPQHIEAGSKDAWGLSGAKTQEHLSGWLPEDFGDDWDFHICEDYHSKDYKGEDLDKKYGAFYAIKNIKNEEVDRPKMWSDIRRPLSAEVERDKVSAELHEHQVMHSKEMEELSREHSKKVSALNALRKELTQANKVVNHPIVKTLLTVRRFIRKVVHKFVINKMSGRG